MESWSSRSEENSRKGGPDRTGFIYSTTTGELGSVDTRVTKSARAGMLGDGEAGRIEQRDHSMIRTKPGMVRGSGML